MLRFLKYKLSLGYFYFALFCLMLLALAEMYLGGFQIKEFHEIFVHSDYLIAILYPLISFFLVWAILKMFTVKEKYQDRQDFYERFVPQQNDNSLSSLLYYGLEKELLSRLKMYEIMMKRGEVYGRIFAVFSLLIPGLAWIYLFFIGGDELADLGFLAFSSMAAGGTIGLTMGIALLKHSKFLQPYIEKLSDEIIRIRKIRIIYMSNDEFIDKAELMPQLLTMLFYEKQNENQDDRNENANSDMPDMGSSLLSTFTSPRN
jgi:hypothetical protein